MRVTEVVIAGLVTLTALMGGCAEDIDTQAPLQASRPNIVLVMTDDQGYGDLGMHDNPVVKTPPTNHSPLSTSISNVLSKGTHQSCLEQNVNDND